VPYLIASENNVLELGELGHAGEHGRQLGEAVERQNENEQMAQLDQLVWQTREMIVVQMQFLQTAVTRQQTDRILE